MPGETPWLWIWQGLGRVEPHVRADRIYWNRRRACPARGAAAEPPETRSARILRLRNPIHIGKHMGAA